MEFKSHDEYQKYLQLQLERVDQTVRTLNRQMFIRLLISLVGFFGAIYFLSTVLNTFSFENPDNFAEFFKIIFSVGLAYLTMQATDQFIRSIQDKDCNPDDLFLKCPYCAQKIKLNPPYQCGWCGHDEKSKNLLVGHLATKSCSTCNQEPAALNCPCCNKDIRMDLTYETAPPQDFGFAGTTTGLQPVEEKSV